MISLYLDNYFCLTDVYVSIELSSDLDRNPEHESRTRLCNRYHIAELINQSKQNTGRRLDISQQIVRKVIL